MKEPTPFLACLGQWDEGKIREAYCFASEQPTLQGNTFVGRFHHHFFGDGKRYDNSRVASSKGSRYFVNREQATKGATLDTFANLRGLIESSLKFGLYLITYFGPNLKQEM